MKILLIAYAFPPYSIVGSIRAQNLADAFLAAGHQVHVLTARLPQDKSRIRLHDGSLTVETVPTWPHPKDLYRWVKRRVAGSAPGPSEDRPEGTEHVQWSPAAEVPDWKRYVISMINVPDDLQGFIVPAIWPGLRVFAASSDLIYTTSPPHSAHIAALGIKMLTRARWIAEFRDPWVGNTAQMVASQASSRPAKALNRWLERRCLRVADRVVTVTEDAARMVGDRMLADAREPVVVRNGISRLLESPVTKDSEPFRVLYVGGTGSRRDPVPFLEAAARLSADSAGTPLRIDFVGNCRYSGDIDLAELASDLGLGGVVRFPGRVPHEEALRLQKEADLLLLLAQKQPAQVPNKLYEYLGANRPILALVDHEGESARMLRRVGGHYLVTEEDDWDVEPALRAAVRTIADGSRFRGDGPDRALLEEWRVERQMRHLLEETGLA